MFQLHLLPKLAFSIVLGWCILGSTNVLAQSLTEIAPSPSQRLFQRDWSFWPSERNRAPRRTNSGSTRNPSCETANNLISLTPHQEIGRTSQARPNVLIHLPTALPRKAVFSISSEEKDYQKAAVHLPQTAGIVSLPLPAEIQDLAAGKQYQWSLVVLCHDELRPDSPVLNGWIETQSTLTAAFPSSAPSLETAAHYRDEALWYDMIAMLAQLKIGQPNNDAVHQAWRNVLERHNLEALSDEPIVP